MNPESPSWAEHSVQQLQGRDQGLEWKGLFLPLGTDQSEEGFLKGGSRQQGNCTTQFEMATSNTVEQENIDRGYILSGPQSN